MNEINLGFKKFSIFNSSSSLDDRYAKEFIISDLCRIGQDISDNECIDDEGDYEAFKI